MRRWLLGGLGALVLLAAVGWFAGPPLVERYAERKLRAALERGGLGGEWASLRWSLAGGVEIEGLKIWRGPHRFAADRLVARVANRKAAFGRIQLTHVEVGPWRATVQAPSADATGAPPAEPPDLGRLVDLLTDAPTVVIGPGTVSVRRDADALVSAQVQAVEVTATSAGISAAASGALEVAWPEVRVRPWAARLRWDPALGEVELDVDGRDGALVEVARGPLDASAEGFRLEQRAGRRWISARGVQGRGGPLEGKVERVRLERRGGEWTVVLSDGSLRVADPDGTDGGGEVAAAPPRALPTQPPIPIEVEEVDVEVEVRGKTLEGHLRWARAAGSRWTAVAEIGGGEAAIELDLIPGTLQPRMVTARMDEVDSEELQAVLRRNWRRPLGRRAALGGKLSGWVTLFRPPEWPEQPLDPEGPLDLEAQLQLDDGIIDWDGVHARPLGGIDGSAAVTARWRPGEALRTVAQVGHHALRGYVAFDVLDLGGDPQAELVVAVDPIDCQSALDALPRSLLGPYQAARVRGHITPWLQIKLPLNDPIGLKLRFEGFLGRCTVLRLNAAREAWPVVKIGGRVADDPGTTRIDDVGWLYADFVMDVREGTSKPVQIGPGLDSYVPLTSLPAYVGAAAYLSEEMEFYNNGAISAGLILRGLRLNLQKGRFVYGGSTVTQQLVKNLFLNREKSLVRKFREGLVAARVVDEVSKDRVLELYLNCIEFGPDVYGIGPASRYYFGKDARDLSPKEAVFLAMLKPAPYQGRIMMRRGYSANYPWWKDRYLLLMQRLVDKGFLTEEALEAEKPLQLYWEKGKYLGSKTALRDPYDEEVEDDIY